MIECSCKTEMSGGEKVNALRKFRESQGLSRQEMANILGVSPSFYEKVEYGDRSMSGNLMRKLKEKFPLIDANVFFLPKNNT